MSRAWLALFIFASRHSNPSRDTAARFILNLTQIWTSKAQISTKINLKFERKTLRRRIFSLDEAEMSRARARINNT